MKQYLLSLLLPLALGAAWKWAQGSGPEKLAGLLVLGIIKLEALLIARWPALAAHRIEANKALETALRDTADQLEKADEQQ